MQAAPLAKLSWLIVLLAGGATSLPLAGPPQPLDPVLSAIAPEECLWYVSTAGLASPDAASGNHTEQLLAEPQVQRLFAEIDKQLAAVLRRAGGPGREQRVLATELPKLARAILSRPLAAYIEKVEVGAENAVTGEAAFILNAGDTRAEIEGALKNLLALIPEKGPQLKTETVAGIEWRGIDLPHATPLRFGWMDSYFIIAVGKDAPAHIVERIGGSAPAWLTKIREEHPLQRESTIGYLNVAGILATVKPLLEARHPEAWPTVERLGLTSVRSLHALAGFDDIGCTSTAHLVTDGTRPGLLAFLPHKPLAAADLALVPQDSLLAVAVQLNPTEVLEQGIAQVSQFHPQAKDDFEAHLWEAENHLGVHPRDEIVAALGDTWVAYLPGGDLLTSWFNAGAAVRVKDAAMLRNSADHLIELARSEMLRTEARVAIGESTYEGATIYSLQFSGDPIPFSPSWAISDKWAIFALQPQAVQSALDRSEEQSLATVPAVSEALSAGEAPAAFFYQDTPQLVRSAYPFIQMGVQMLSAAVRREGIEIDTTALPGVDTIVKHLRPTISTFASRKDGFHATSQGSMPAGGNFIGSAPFAAGLILPAVQAARVRGRAVEDMNNMRQLALAFHNYVSAYNEFPTDVYAADGTPLLSWRVKLLPFMEVAAELPPNQIRMNEPWDSEHNRQFHDRMPLVFSSPSTERISGQTRFLALKGAETLFPGKEKIGFRDVTDGTSNTVLFVEAAPAAAVNWMEPADIDFNAEQPFARIAQPSGDFLAAYCDGSVHRLSLGIGKEAMKALATRAGGEIIDALDHDPAPWLYEEHATGAAH